MPAINLNTASYEDRLELEGIGQHRATAILKLREEKGCITEDDIRQSLQGTYSTIRTLLDDEKVSQDIPPRLTRSVNKPRATQGIQSKNLLIISTLLGPRQDANT